MSKFQPGDSLKSLALDTEILYPRAMSVPELERAVSQLNSNELEQFSSWFAGFKNQLWDDQFKQDVQSGKLDKLADQALESYRRGDYRKL